MFDSIKLLQSEIWSSPLLMLLFVASVIYLVYLERKEAHPRIRFLLLYSGLVLVLYLINPIVAFGITNVAHDPYAFVRLAWLVPAFPVMAYAAKECVVGLQGKKRGIATIVLVATIICSGTYLTYVNVRATNAYKLPEEVKATCDIILEREGITDPLMEGNYITVDVQLHDTNIYEDGSDSNVFYFGIRQYAKGLVLMRTTIAPSEYEKEDFSYEGYFSNHCRYYICDKSEYITRELGKIGYELIGETEAHNVYENTYSYNLYLVRHGQTEANVAEQLVGHSESPMTEEGQKTTKELGKALEGVTFTKAYTSPLERTTQTAMNVLTESGNGDTPLEEILWISDINFGEAEGMTWDEIRAKYGENMDFKRVFGPIEDADYTQQIPNADTLYLYAQTVTAGMNVITTQGAIAGWEDENVLVANHSAIRYWLEQQLPDQYVPAGMQNAGLTVLHYDRGIWSVELMDETDYEAIPELLEDVE